MALFWVNCQMREKSGVWKSGVREMPDFKKSKRINGLDANLLELSTTPDFAEVGRF